MKPPRPPRFLIALLASGAATTCALAAEHPYVEDLPLVLTAARLPQPLHEVPGAVTVIDRETIAATGYRELARVFRLVPGMQVGQERGHAQWVSYHGLSNDFPTEMQVLIDGRSVITPSAFGGVDWSALPLTLDEIDRIEIVRGTNANSYGANAFLGVINIITRHSAEGGGKRGVVRLGDGVRDAEAGWSGGDGPLSLRLAAASQRDDGFDRLRDDRRMDTLTLRGDWQLSPADSLMLRAGASTGERGEGYADSLFGNNAPRDSRSETATARGLGLEANTRRRAERVCFAPPGRRAPPACPR
jgi:iron complex outermembrane recepter protein